MEVGNSVEHDNLLNYLGDFSSVLQWQMICFRTSLDIHQDLPRVFKNRAELALSKAIHATKTLKEELLVAATGVEWWEEGGHDRAQSTMLERPATSFKELDHPELGKVVSESVVQQRRIICLDEIADWNASTGEVNAIEADADAQASFSLGQEAARTHGALRKATPNTVVRDVVIDETPEICRFPSVSSFDASDQSNGRPLDPEPRSRSHSKTSDEDHNENGPTVGRIGTAATTRSSRGEDPGVPMAMRSIDLDGEDDDEDPPGIIVHGVLNPNFPGRLAWDLNTMVLVMCDSLILPFQMAYVSGQSPSGFAVFWLWLTTGFFACDICLNFFTAYAAGKKDIEEPGKLVTNRLRIARHYSRTWLPIDFVSTVPWGVFANVLLGGDAGSAGKLGKLTKVIKFIRFMRLMRMLRLAKLATIWERVEAKCGSVILLQGVGLLRVLFVLICICHWNACIWWMVGQPQSIITELLSDEAQRSWAAKPHWTTIERTTYLGEDPWSWGQQSIQDAYIFCFYWTLGVMRTMPAEVTPVSQAERLYIMIFMFFAFSAFAICVAEITQTYFKFSDRKRAFAGDMSAVRFHLRKLEASDQLQAKIKVYLRHLYDIREFSAREKPILNLLPDHHKKELQHIKYCTPLSTVPLFSGVSWGALRVVTDCTVSREMGPGDVCSWRGTPARHAWVPTVGRLRIRAEAHDNVDDGTVAKIVIVDEETLTTQHEYLSELTVICITACNVLKIDKEKFVKATLGNGAFWNSAAQSKSRSSGRKDSKRFSYLKSFSRSLSSERDDTCQEEVDDRENVPTHTYNDDTAIQNAAVVAG